jgi:hypothetical protein
VVRLKFVALLALAVVVVFAGMGSPATARATLIATAFCDVDTLNNCRNTSDPATATIRYECFGQIHGDIGCQQTEPPGGFLGMHFGGVVTDLGTGAQVDSYEALKIPHPNKNKKCKKKRHHHRICHKIRVK